MKQIISVADMAIIFELINREIIRMKNLFSHDILSKDTKKKQLEEYKAQLEENPYYHTLLHVKKALENCNIEIEVPDIKVEDESK